MDLKEFGSKLVKLAPAIGGAFLGPGGAAAGALLSIIAESFGLKSDADPEDVLNAISADPEAAIKLRALGIAHEETIARLNNERVLEGLRIDLENVKSAREREVKVTQATGKKEVNLYVLAWLIVFGFFGSLIVLIVQGVAIENTARDAVMMLLGALVASYRDVGNYFFGSSKSSTDKTKLLAGGKPD